MRIWLFPVFLMLLVTSCKNTSNSANVTKPTEEELNSFASFYKQFHEDSTFQIQHITFPLQGLPERADSATLASGTFRWTRDNWKIQEAFDPSNSQFEQDFLPLGEDMIIEKLTHKKWGLAITRRFAKMDDGWYLIYYSGLNKVGSDNTSAN